MRNLKRTNAKTDKIMSTVLLTRDIIEPKTICIKKCKHKITIVTFITMLSQHKQH